MMEITFNAIKSFKFMFNLYHVSFKTFDPLGNGEFVLSYAHEIFLFFHHNI